MAHDGTGAGYDTAAPADGDNISDGAKEVRDLRLGLKYRLEKEHKSPVAGTVTAGDLDLTGGGEHLEGSAVAYVEATAPTTTPGGDALAAGDAGRLWVDSDDDFLYYYDGTGWVAIGFILGTSNLADDAVTTVKILDDNVTNAKLAASAVAGSASGATGDNVVEAASIAAADLENKTVTAAKIAAATITRAELADTNYVLIREEQAAGTDAGGFTTGDWRQRINLVEVSDLGANASLASDEITLVSGTYEVRISCPGFKCGNHQAQLWNQTAGSSLLGGSSEQTTTSAGSNIQSRSVIVGRITVAAGQALRIRHQCSSTQASNGFGSAANFGLTEVYTIAEFRRVA